MPSGEKTHKDEIDENTKADLAAAWEHAFSDKPWNLREWCKSLAQWCNSNTKLTHLITGGPGTLNTEAWVFDEFIDYDLKIMGFEPQSLRYENLSEKFPGELFNLGLAAECCVIEGYTGFEGGGNDFKREVTEAERPWYKKQKIEMTTVDEVLSNEDNCNAFLWIDVEGAEYDILRGSISSLIKGKVNFINLELTFSEKLIEKSRLMHALLLRLGYVPVGASGAHTAKTVTLPNGQQQRLVTTFPSETEDHIDVFYVRNVAVANLLNLNSQVIDKF